MEVVKVTGSSFKSPLSIHHSMSMEGKRGDGHFFCNYFLLAGDNIGILEWNTLTGWENYECCIPAEENGKGIPKLVQIVWTPI